MNYQETLKYLFTAAPMFQNIGAGAYKEGLSTSQKLDQHFGHPHRAFRTIHVAGTNGKGSCSHTLAALLQVMGYRVGLYTSPHLVDFRERIRVNGQTISQDRVVRFVEEERHFFEPLQPSFFELTTALAFLHFAEQKVDFAVVEVGLGGRLDCTNIIQPELCLITNISHDHSSLLGETLTQIATEKAGIIKPSTPVVVGEVREETRSVFESTAAALQAPLFFAEETPAFDEALDTHQAYLHLRNTAWGDIHFGLSGVYQKKNANTLLNAIAHFPEDLRQQLSSAMVQRAFSQVCALTGLQGRWQQLNDAPLTICDTGHNPAAWQHLTPQLAAQTKGLLHIVFGVCADKDVTSILQLLPQQARYYFTAPSVGRALCVDDLQSLALSVGLLGESYPTVTQAYEAAQMAAQPTDTIFIGGSSFVVADLLASFES